MDNSEYNWCGKINERKLFYKQVHNLIDKYDLDSYDNEYKGEIDEFDELDGAVNWRISKTYFPPIKGEGGFAEWVFTKTIYKKMTKRGELRNATIFKVWVYPKFMSDGTSYTSHHNKLVIENGNWIALKEY